MKQELIKTLIKLLNLLSIILSHMTKNISISLKDKQSSFRKMYIQDVKSTQTEHSRKIKTQTIHIKILLSLKITNFSQTILLHII